MFRVIEITTYNDGTKTAKGIYDYEDDNDAIATFHQKLGGMMKLAKVQTEMVMVITEDGRILKRRNPDDTDKYFSEYFVRGIPSEEEPTPGQDGE